MSEQSTNSLMKELMQRLEAGEITRADAQRQLTAHLGIKGCRQKEQTYNCAVCLDTGKVDVWCDEAIAEFVENQVHPDQARYREMVCACFCKAGEIFIKRAKHPLPRVDPDKHCIIEPRGGASTVPCKPEAIANLLTWINGQTQKAEKARREQDPLFNQGGR